MSVKYEVKFLSLVNLLISLTISIFIFPSVISLIILSSSGLEFNIPEYPLSTYSFTIL